MHTHMRQCCSVVVGSVKDHVDSDDDDEDEEMVVEEGAKAFGNDWLPPKKTAEYDTLHFGLSYLLSDLEIIYPIFVRV